MQIDIVEAAMEVGAKVIILHGSSRKTPKEYDAELYKEQNLIERMSNKLKHFRQVATRCDKLDVAYLGFVFIARIYL